MSKLKLNAIGHLGHDCSVKHMTDGNCVINFSIACTDKYKDKQGNMHEKTTWIDCALWRKADKIRIADFLKKGQLVAVEGRPESRAFLSREGEARSVLQTRVDELILLGSTSNKNTTPAAVEQTSVPENNAEVFTASSQEGDLPF